MSRSRRKKSSRPWWQSPVLWAFTGTLFLVVLIGLAFNKWERDSLAETSKADNANSTMDLESDFPRLKQEYFRIKSSNKQQNSTSSAKPAVNLQEQINISKRLFSIARSPEDREFAQLNLLNDYLQFYVLSLNRNLDLTAINQALDKLVKEFSTDENLAVKQRALRIPFEMAMMRIGKSDSPEPIAQEIAPTLTQIARQFPDDQAFADALASFANLFKSNPAKSAANAIVAQALIDGYAETKSPRLQAWRADLQDNYWLYEGNFYGLLLEITARHEPAGDQMIVLIKDLIKKPLQANGVNQILAVGEQFEMSSWYGRSREVYTLVQDYLAKHEIPQRAELQIKTKFGFQRLSLLNAQLRFKDTDVKGQTLTEAKYANRVLLVMFFDNVEQLDRIAGYQNQLQQMLRHDLSCLAVIMNPVSEDILEQMRAETAEFDFIVDPNASSSLFAACPVAATPYLLIVNREGQVTHLNVSLNDLLTELEGLLF